MHALAKPKKFLLYLYSYYFIVHTEILDYKFITNQLPKSYDKHLIFHKIKNRKINVFEKIMPNYKTKTTIFETLPSTWNLKQRTIEKSLNIFKTKFKNTCFDLYQKEKCTKKNCYSCGV